MLALLALTARRTTVPHTHAVSRALVAIPQPLQPADVNGPELRPRDQHEEEHDCALVSSRVHLFFVCLTAAAAAADSKRRKRGEGKEGKAATNLHAGTYPPPPANPSRHPVPASPSRTASTALSTPFSGTTCRRTDLSASGGPGRRLSAVSGVCGR